jgi:integrase
MSIYRDRRGNLNVAVQRNGRRLHTVLPPGASRETAKETEARLCQDLYTRQVLKKRPVVRLGDAIKRFLDERVIGSKSERATVNHAMQLEEWVKGKLITDAVDVWERYKKFHRGRLAAATINRKGAILRCTLNMAFSEWEWLDEPLGKKIKLLPENNEREVFLTKEEVVALVEACACQETRDAIWIAVHTGMRAGELVKLTPADIVNRQGVRCFRLTNTKNGKSRFVPIIPAIEDAVSRLPFRRGYRNIYKWYERAVEAVGLGDVVFHDLRHSAASLLLAEGVPLEIIGHILGHQSAKSTRRYTHLQVDTAMAALKKIG